MGRYFQSARTYLVIYGVVLGLGLLLLFGASLVPRSLIQKHMEDSAWLLTDNTVIYNWVEGIEASKAHRYSDCVTLSIAYQMDELPGLKGPLRAWFYWNGEQHTNHNFSDAVHEGIPANENYSRYWHGSAALMRIAHVFTSIGTIYNVHFVLASLLFLLLLWQLMRLGMPDAALCMTAALLRWKRLDRVCALYAAVGCVPFVRFFCAARAHSPALLFHLSGTCGDDAGHRADSRISVSATPKSGDEP